MGAQNEFSSILVMNRRSACLSRTTNIEPILRSDEGKFNAKLITH